MGPDEPRYPFGLPFGWFQIAWADDIAPGDVVPRYYFGRHLALWRDDDGHAHVNDAFCPHLGAHFGYGGRVDGTELVCPFHGWQFDTDGFNTEIPYGNRVNARARIRTYPVREIDQFVLCWYHPEDQPPSYEVDTPPEFGDAEYGEWTNVSFTVAAACQEMAENSVDGPHFRYVHQTATVPEIQSYETDGPRSRMRSVQRFPTPRGVVDGRIDVDNQGPGFAVTRFSGIVDTLLIGGRHPRRPRAQRGALQLQDPQPAETPRPPRTWGGRSSPRCASSSRRIDRSGRTRPTSCDPRSPTPIPRS